MVCLVSLAWWTSLLLYPNSIKRSVYMNVLVRNVFIFTQIYIYVLFNLRHIDQLILCFTATRNAFSFLLIFDLLLRFSANKYLNEPT